MRLFLSKTILAFGLVTALLGVCRQAGADFIVTNPATANLPLPLVSAGTSGLVPGQFPSASTEALVRRFLPRAAKSALAPPEASFYTGPAPAAPLDSVFWTILADASEKPHYVWFPPEDLTVPSYSPTLLMTSRLAAYTEGGLPGQPQPPGAPVNLDRDVVPEPATIALNVLVIGSALLLASRIPKGKSAVPPKR